MILSVDADIDDDDDDFVPFYRLVTV